ncbi:MAG TPA: hypothetical protein VMD27_08680 [Candidatus Aquilonibacter sp.]|nr:hypothetical protein [Candidatus Aquilonibacter sp.]
MSFLPLVRFWIWVSAFATLAGWTLSALGQLNRPGYAVSIAAFVLFIFFRRKDLVPRREPPAKKISRGKKFLRRFRRPLPLCFAMLASLIFLGGVIYAPTHYVALTYHIPRVLHWLADGRWHWIHTPVERMNYSGCDFEWLFTPLLLFTKSYHPLFLLNFISFLLLPGLVFSVFTRLGVHPRVARQWMWLLPAGYIFLLQAGSAGNDAFSAVFALAAIDFGCRARVSRQTSDLWFSLLAAALMTGVKPISAPLLLPWLISVFPLLPALRHKWISTTLALAVAAAISFFPIAVMNHHYSGDWLGTPLEPSRLDVHNPLIGILGNGFELLQDNFVPPFFPPSHWWDQHVQSFVPNAWLMDFQDGFFATGELPTEDWAGVGFGVSILALISWIASFWVSRFARRNGNPNSSVSARWCRWVLIAPWLALLVYCAKAGMATPARLIAPYYPLLLPLLLVGAGQSQIIRRRWWRSLAYGVMFLAFVVLAMSPDRPLWPAQTILSKLAARHPNSSMLSRALTVYSTYSHRSDPLAGVRALLPPDIRVVGFIGDADDCDISLWLPLGSRHVEHFLLSDPPEEIRARNIQYVVLGGYNLKAHEMTLDDWLQKSGAQLVASTNATLKISEGPQSWFVVRFK